jgi:O-antigen ligase
MIVVIFYAISRMSGKGLFNQQAAHLSASPFFRDHTSYGAILAMLLPFSVGFALTPRYTAPFRMICWGIVSILLFALLLSYTRAAWLSILVALAVFLLFVIRIKVRYLLAFIGVLVIVFLGYRTEIMLELKSNRQDSSKDLMKHVKSIANISTDVSNKERLNRWHSAFGMIQEKPFLGWGPGTFMFQYAPFQNSHYKTPISTNWGNMGNAHSEYIGSFAESGLFGCLSLIGIMIVTIITAFKVYIRSANRLQVRIIVLSASLGLVTYYTHGFLNNFLDTDKASALFWGFTAMIAALDVYHLKKQPS